MENKARDEAAEAHGRKQDSTYMFTGSFSQLASRHFKEGWDQATQAQAERERILEEALEYYAGPTHYVEYEGRVPITDENETVVGYQETKGRVRAVGHGSKRAREALEKVRQLRGEK